LTTIRVALVGAGAWGSNLLRVLVESPRVQVIAVADPDPRRRTRASALAKEAVLVATLDDALALGVDAVILATPADTHATLTLAALDAGVDVFVEKPLSMRVADADHCAQKAAALGRIGMVGHLLRYHPVVVRLLELAHGGALGALEHVETARLSSTGNLAAPVLWTLGPHDLSVLHALDPSPIRALRASSPESGDTACIDLALDSRLTARLALSRIHPTKERQIAVIGADGTAVFDDVRAPDRVLLGRAKRGRCGAVEITVTEAVPVAWREPLAAEIDHFLQCVSDRTPPLTSFADGALVVRALALASAAAQRRVDRTPSQAARGMLAVEVAECGSLASSG
jgi:predicted dehydrogenase